MPSRNSLNNADTQLPLNAQPLTPVTAGGHLQTARRLPPSPPARPYQYHRDGINVQDTIAPMLRFRPTSQRRRYGRVHHYSERRSEAGFSTGRYERRADRSILGAAFFFNRSPYRGQHLSIISAVQRPFLNRISMEARLVVLSKTNLFGTYEVSVPINLSQRRFVAERGNGIFTYRDTTGATRTVNLLGGGFAAATGVTAIDPVITSRILSALPTAGNNATLGDQLNTTGLTFSRATNTDREAFTTRYDWSINSDHSIEGVFAYKKENNLRNDVDGQQGLTVASTACCYTSIPYGFQGAHTPFLSLAWHWQISNNLTNEVRGWQGSDPLSVLTLPACLSYSGSADQQPRERLSDQATPPSQTRGDNAVDRRYPSGLVGQFQGFYAPPDQGAGQPHLHPQSEADHAGIHHGNTGSSTRLLAVCATGANCQQYPGRHANNLLALLGGLIGTAARLSGRIRWKPAACGATSYDRLPKLLRLISIVRDPQLTPP